MSLILMTTLFYKAVILQGEIWRWSLLGLKGLNNLLCNMKISDYFWRNSMINLDKGLFPYWKHSKKPDFQC